MPYAWVSSYGVSMDWRILPKTCATSHSSLQGKGSKRKDHANLQEKGSKAMRTSPFQGGGGESQKGKQNAK
jgi:hypothetical protein